MYDLFFKHAYLIGALIFFLVWLPIFLKRKDLRKEMVFAGLLGSLLAMTDVLWVPEYWNPPFLFDLMNKIGITIEDFSIGFFEGGVAAVLFEIFEKRREYKIRKDYKSHFATLLIFILFYAGLEFLYPNKTLINWCIAAMAASAIAWYFRRDLNKQMLVGGGDFSPESTFCFSNH